MIDEEIRPEPRPFVRPLPAQAADVARPVAVGRVRGRGLQRRPIVR